MLALQDQKEGPMFEQEHRLPCRQGSYWEAEEPAVHNNQVKIITGELQPPTTFKEGKCKDQHKVRAARVRHKTQQRTSSRLVI
jgi:hypothetical protein